MPANFTDEFILLFKAEARQAIQEVLRVGQTIKQTQQTAESLNKSFGKEFNAIGRYYSVMGSKQEEIGEKINLVKGNIRSLSKVESQSARESMVSQKALLGTLQNQATALQKQLPLANQLATGLKQLGGPAGQAGVMLENLVSGAGSAVVSMGLLGAAVAGLAAEWKMIIEPGLKFNMMLEQQQMAFTIMLKSANSAKTMLSDLKNVTLTTGVSLSDSLASTKQFLAYGFKGSEIVSSLKMLNTVAKAVGIPMNDLVYVYGTLRAQGRAYTRDLMQFGMRGIPIYEELAKVLGVNIDQVQKLTEAGNVGFTEVQQAFQNMTGEGGRFAGMLEGYMKTTDGLITQIKNQWQLFTGGAASLSKGPVRSILQSFLKILQYSGGIREAINLLWGALTGFAALLVKSVELLMGVVQFYVRIWEEQAKVIIGIGKWFSELKLVKDIFAYIYAFFFPMIRDIGIIVNKIKEGAAAFKEWLVPEKTVKYVIDTSGIEASKGSAGFGSLRIAMDAMTKEGSRFQELLKDENFDDLVKSAIASFHAFMNVGGGFSATELTTVLAKVMNVSKDQFDKMMEAARNATTETVSYWKDFIDYMDQPSNFYVSGVEDVKTGFDAATVAIKAHEDELAALKSGLTITGASEEIFAEQVKAAKQKTYDSLQKTIDMMRAQPKYMTVQGIAFIKAIQDYLDELYKDLKGKPEALDALLEKYIDFRATMEKWGSWENPDIKDFLGKKNVFAPEGANDPAWKKLKGHYYNLRRILEGIIYDWNKARKEVNDAQNGMSAEQKKIELLAIDTMEAEQMTKAIYEDKKTLLEHQLEVTKDLSGQLEIIGDLYATEREHILLIQDDYLRTYELAKLNLDIEEKKLAIYKEQVKILTGGKASGGGEKLFLAGQKNLANAVRGAERPLTPKDPNNFINQIKGFTSSIQESIDAIGQMSAGAFEMAAGDSELMGIINGSLDPLSAIIMGLIEMMVQIENVNKVLNPITTLLEGTKTTIEREFNTALQPVVNILVKLGEIIGQVLLIPLEYLSWCIESVGAPILLLVEFIKMFAAAVKPIVVLVMKLLNPVIMLLDILNTFVGLSTSAIEMEAARQAALQDLYDKELKSLQDLYNVGALSGAEYEAGLAALKSRYPTEEGGTQLSPREQAFADWLQGIWTGINAIALWCENAYASWIAPIIEALDYIWAGIATPELTLAMQELGVAFGGLADSMSGVMLSLIQIIADILVALAPLIIWFMNTFLLGILIPAIQLITATIELFAGAFGVVANIINLLWGAINWFFSWIMGDSTARKAAETTMYYALLGIQIGLITMANGVIYAINALYLGAVGALNALITLFHGDPIVVQGIPYIPSAATGTGYLPSDMTIQAHKGEIIAPNSFASEIRKGNLTLSGPRSSGSGGDVYNVTVNGSILTEREVISLVAEGIHSQKVKGYA